jgi:hypothetical protein
MAGKKENSESNTPKLEFVSKIFLWNAGVAWKHRLSSGVPA